jgi:hypothetical protein
LNRIIHRSNIGPCASCPANIGTVNIVLVSELPSDSEPDYARRANVKHTAAGRALRDQGWTRTITDSTRRIAERVLANNFEFGQTIGTVSVVDIAKLHTFSPSSADFAGLKPGREQAELV